MKHTPLGNALAALALLACGFVCASDFIITDDNSLEVPAVGSHGLRVISPTILELTLITTKKPDPARVQQWDFVDDRQQLRLPEAPAFKVAANGRPVDVRAVGFKRRVLFAPYPHRDLRIGNHLYIELGSPVGDGESVEVTNTARLWPENVRFAATASPQRLSPVIHVNEVGYLPAMSKKAMIGLYLGSLGELDVGAIAAQGFCLIDAHSAKEMFRGRLVRRADQGFSFPCYRQVFEADFTEFKTPGEYRLQVAGLGVSFPFFINEGVAAAFARTYALGLYHQRCGGANQLPFSRFTHGPCHMAPAEIPPPAFDMFIAQSSADFASNPRHTAPQLKNVGASLYPFVKRGKVDVSGGHHDAGDYSKYTSNSATLIHHLVFAVDAFPGAGALDNLGLPESGDGKSDLLQEAKWEADFLAKMQDDDGGFYFLVYPRKREYENNVLPDAGDPQLVWPKNTAVTAAAVAALAQASSSPLFKSQFPEAAAMYLTKAKKGWDFLQRAIARYGYDGSYQKLTHYGNEYMHDDELAWATCEMFIATGDPKLQEQLIKTFDPANASTRRWGWQRLSESYGNAIRSFAFAARCGKLKSDQLDRPMLKRCEAELALAADDHLQRSAVCAYGTSFPVDNKRFRNAGWYFGGDAAFDLAVASQLEFPIFNDPRKDYLDAILANLNFEAGCNPVNVSYLTGLGWKRQRAVVHQIAWNQRQQLPPTGIPLGQVQAGFGWVDVYGKETGLLSFPSDGGEPPYPFYDRWADAFNLSQEFVIVNQARSLAYLAWLMGQTSVARQPWKSAVGKIVGVPSKPSVGTKFKVTLQVEGLDLSEARIVWEGRDKQPILEPTLDYTTQHAGPQWLEVEAQWPDGRRVFAVDNF